MKHFGEESHLRCLVGVILGKFQYEFKGPSFPGRVVRPKDNCLPNHDIRVHGGTSHTGWWIILEPCEKRIVVSVKRGVYCMIWTMLYSYLDKWTWIEIYFTFNGWPELGPLELVIVPLAHRLCRLHGSRTASWPPHPPEFSSKKNRWIRFTTIVVFKNSGLPFEVT